MTEATEISVHNILCLIDDARSTRGVSRTLLNVLAAHCKPATGRICWPGYNPNVYLMDFETFQRATKKLIKRGLIIKSSLSNEPHVYYINLPMLKNQAEQVSKKKRVPKAEKDALLDLPGEIADRVGRDCYLVAEYTGNYPIN